MALSIPELPPDAIGRQHSRHFEALDYVVLVREKIALLVGNYRPQDPDLNDSRERFGDFRSDVTGGERKIDMASVLEYHPRFHSELAPRKSPGEIVGVV